MAIKTHEHLHLIPMQPICCDIKIADIVAIALCEQGFKTPDKKQSLFSVPSQARHSGLR